ncbi:CDC11 [Ecytonucleospora hepatopenaei]|uniref:CDC11 n=1 Tax=Ecytonucleospora hepatopenaei TaxID=646526 RepID=A0A1W0E8J7_9MICR|nr:CDC11 [Ecytonucleospora hepatopenaei]
MNKQPSRFTIMAAGAKRSGKSQFFNNIVGKNIIPNDSPNDINVYMLNLDCEGVMQKITFVDTPGFGDKDTETIQNNIVDFIKDQFDQYMEEESKIRRNPKYEDTRVHCLLYFLPATGYGLKQSDLIFLEKVKNLVNIIPVISKADGLTPEDKEEYKKFVKNQFEMYSIPVFDLENHELLLDDVADLNLNSHVPFAVINGEDEKIKNINGLTIEVDNPNFNDLSVLREILLSSHLDAFIDVTSTVLYENYRTNALESALNDNKRNY